jgi:glycerol-3-phosphate dehydrogenase
MGYTPHVLVIGGGVTGAGVARDLAMRGLEVTLVEQGPLTNGATGRMHGLLHSGARYAVSDPESAADCLSESRIVREIAGHTVEDTGGLFVEHPDDPDDYFAEKRDACEAVGIPIEELSGEQARESEAGLAGDVERALAVPDATIDPFRLTAATAQSAQNYGAATLTHAEVVGLLGTEDAVSGVRVRESAPAGQRDEQPAPDEVAEIEADYVVNATGAWADRIASMAGVDVSIRRSKGAMVIAADRHVDTVVNRCRPKGEGDILVPHGDVSILGTTDVPVDDPETFSEEAWEVERLVDELSPVVPSLGAARLLRSYWGVRPLYEPPEKRTADATTTDLARDFVVLDHEERDGLWGMTTIVGGKLTTHRLMAERVADQVCAKFGISRDCATDEYPLPGSDSDGEVENALAEFGVDAPTYERTRDRLGGRAPEVLATDGSNPVVCPCRGVTRPEIREAIDDEGVYETDLDAVRVHTGVATGECQGALCCHRVAAELHPEHAHATVDSSLDEMYQERWQGQRHTLWGEQLSRAMGAYALHATTMSRDQSPEAVDLDRFDDGPAFEDSSEANS